MNVLVTGGAGYIGSVLVRMLLERGHGVTVLDRFFFGRESLAEVADRIKLVQDDVRWFDTSVLKGIDAVIDMAALSNDPSGELDPAKTLEINHAGRVRVAKLAKEKGAQKYLLASSCSVYGFQPGTLDEKSPVNPLTTYAKANVLWENDALALSDKSYSVTALRQSTVYGYSPRMRFDIAINGMTLGFFKSGKIPIMRDGTQWRPFVHVRDTAKAFIAVLEAGSDEVAGERFNVGSKDQNYQILPLAKIVAEAIGVPFEFEWYGSPDTRSYVVSFEKIASTLKFKPDYTPVEGAREIYAALKDGSLTDGPKTKTVEWYKHLIAMDALVSQVKMRDNII